MSNLPTISNHFSNPNVTAFLEQQLGDKKGSFVSNVIALTDSNPALNECDPGALIKCAMNATALDLPLNNNLGYAYVIPYNKKPQFQIGYKGFIQLALRTNAYRKINTCDVREGEIEIDKFTGDIVIIGAKPENKIIGYLAYIELLNGFSHSKFMSTIELEAHAMKYSKTYAKYKTGLWKTDLPAMSKKTVLKLLLGKYGVLSTEMQKAIVIDQQVGSKYEDNPSSDISISDKKASMRDSNKPKIDMA